MPLIKHPKNESQKKKNYLELTVGGVGSARHKAIRTLMKRKGMGYEEARRYMAKIIAFAPK